MYILGINAYHGDASACLIRDGKIVVAIEEERIRRIKHWAGFPSESIKYCLDYADITIDEVDHIGISRNPKANFWKKVYFSLTSLRNYKTLFDRARNLLKVNRFQKHLANNLHVDAKTVTAQIHNVEHHRSHMASTFFVSPFDEAAILSIDGFGDFSSTMTGVGKDNHIDVIDQVTYPHSLGSFYSAFTQFLGFSRYGDEYKVMGLSAYGEPTYLDQMRDVVHLTDEGLFELNLDYFIHHRQGVQMKWEGGKPHFGRLYNQQKFQEVFGPSRQKGDEITERHANIAASVQKVTEETIFHILNHLHNQTGFTTICLAGGVSQNSVANGKIVANTPFEKIYIPPAGHDAGTAMGAAYYIYHQVLDQPRSFVVNEAYFGLPYEKDEIRSVLEEEGLWEQVEELDEETLLQRVVEDLQDGKVVGWFQDRFEFGPRALGNRSILADPRRDDMRDIINQKVKFREKFRPFAPSVLAERVNDFFENGQEQQADFMEKVFPVRQERQADIPAVTHADGTGRLQTVRREQNELYWKLLKQFEKATNIPILLNTSFNENEPIVNHPEEAVDCYMRTDIDTLVLGSYYITRHG